jgi:hypothetical protein
VLGPAIKRDIHRLLGNAKTSHVFATYQIFGRSDKVHHSVVQLGPTPPVSGLVRLRVPVKQLRDLVSEVAHAAFPASAAFNELYVWVDVSPATTASSDDRVADDRNGLLFVQPGM